MFCKQHSINVTGCSFQVSQCTKELCDRCISTRVVSDNSNPWLGYWKEKVGIVSGDTKEDVYKKLRDFREDCPTCVRCGGTEYTTFCSMSTVCKQSEEVIEDVGNAKGNGHRSRANEVDESKTLRVELSQNRERDAIREIV